MIRLRVRRHRRRPGWWRVAAFVALEVVLVAAIPLLAWVGFRTVLDTTAGTAVDPELDPDEPGYEAFLEPTPVALAIGVDGDDALSWLAVLALGGPDEQGGSVLLLSPSTLLATDAPSGRSPQSPAATLAGVWAEGRERALTLAVADLLGAGIDDHAVVDPERLAVLVAPVAPLDVTLADDLPGFEPGDVRLDADEVAELVQLRAQGESDVARLVRQEEVWRAWLGAIASAEDPNAVPGETTTGLGRFIRGVAAGRAVVDSAPVVAEIVEVAVVDDEGAETGEVEEVEVLAADVEALRNLVEERVPFPIAPRPGMRPRVRVLDGTGTPGLSVRVARDVVRAGGQVTVVGNADRFDLDVSRVVYFDSRLADEAAAVGAALGIDAVQQADGPNPDDLVDVTVVVGTDLAPAYR